MRDLDQHKDDSHRWPATSYSPESNTTSEKTATNQVSHLRLGERVASRELFTLFLFGKRLYMGMPEPYQFVEVPGNRNPGLHYLCCPCLEHQGQAGVHILDTSEVTLVLECGAERVWVFISIPARHRAKYAWLPTLEFGLSDDAELCGVLIADAS